MGKTDETRLVKAALNREGISFRRVGHGTGTAAGWLRITGVAREYQDRALAVVQRETGRYGPWDGHISIYE